MNIAQAFDEQPWASRLARRYGNFRAMCQHAADFADKHGSCYIIETGSAWDKDNWEGQGQSTLIWDWLLKLVNKPKPNETTLPILHALSIDITPTSTENAKAQCSSVCFICGDSVATLNGLDKDLFEKCGLLYLDSFDWTAETNLEAAFHHIAELAAVWRLLPDGCMVIVDDRHGDQKGKHWMVEAFMGHYLKKDPVFKNHQIGWVK